MVRGGKKIYNPNIDKKYLDKKKEEMHRDIKQHLVDIGKNYAVDKVNDDQHIKNINELKNYITTKYEQVLFEGKLRFGVAQKILNLYLKYLWALDWINSPPPHCPIDGQISNELKSSYKFAKSDDVDEYKEIIIKANQTAKNNGVGIAEWETNKFLETNYSQLDFSKVD